MVEDNNARYVVVTDSDFDGVGPDLQQRQSGAVLQQNPVCLSRLPLGTNGRVYRIDDNALETKPAN
jgi:hypothetical protein